MTRQQFIAKAVRRAEQDLRIPPGWWGIYRDVGNNYVRVKFSTRGSGWFVYERGKIVSKHDSRLSAINKARKLDR